MVQWNRLQVEDQGMQLVKTLFYIFIWFKVPIDSQIVIKRYTITKKPTKDVEIRFTPYLISVVQNKILVRHNFFHNEMEKKHCIRMKIKQLIFLVCLFILKLNNQHRNGTGDGTWTCSTLPFVYVKQLHGFTYDSSVNVSSRMFIIRMMYFYIHQARSQQPSDSILGVFFNPNSDSVIGQNTYLFHQTLPPNFQTQ